MEELIMQKSGKISGALIMIQKKSIKFLNNRVIKYFFSRIAPRVYSSFETVSRKEYKHAKLRSKLMDEYFNHDPLNGPLKYFDLKLQE